MSTMVVFKCPKNGHAVNSVILTDAVSFAAMLRKEVELRCPECGTIHRWWMAEGQLSLHDSAARWPVAARVL